MKSMIFSALVFSAFSNAATVFLGAPAAITATTFDVDVDVNNVFANFPGEAVTGFGFNVTVTAGVTFSGATVNSTFFDDFSGCCLGTDIVGLSNLSFPAGVGAGDFSEPLMLATLHFSLSGSGPVTVGVTADNLADANQGIYFLSGAESFSASEDVGAIPEPSTILLSALGLLGISASRKAYQYVIFSSCQSLPESKSKGK